MNDTEFHTRIDLTLRQVEQYIEQLTEDFDLDPDFNRSGNVLTLDFGQAGKLILNSQAANHELWLAARSGGFHYGFKDGQWFNKREGVAFDRHFVEVLSVQIGLECPPLKLET